MKCFIPLVFQAPCTFKVPIFWDPKTSKCRLVAIRTLRSNSRRWGEVHMSQWRGPTDWSHGNHTPMDTWTGRGQGPLNRCRYCQPRRGFLFSSEFLGFSSQKNGCGITHLTQPSDGSGIFGWKRLFFFGHEDTQIIHFHMGRHEASRQKKDEKIPTNLWMISPSPRKSELYQKHPWCLPELFGRIPIRAALRDVIFSRV